MRKNVEPHTAVTPTSSSVASRARPAGAVTAGQTIVSVMVLPLGALLPPAGSCSRTVPKNPPRARRTSTLNPAASSALRAWSSCCPTTFGHVDEHRTLGHHERHGVAAEQGAVARAPG